MAGASDKPDRPGKLDPLAPAEETPFGADSDDWESELAAWDRALPIATSGEDRPGAAPTVENPFAETPVTLVSNTDPAAVMQEHAVQEVPPPPSSFDDGTPAPASGSYAVLIATAVSPTEPMSEATGAIAPPPVPTSVGGLSAQAPPASVTAPAPPVKPGTAPSPSPSPSVRTSRPLVPSPSSLPPPSSSAPAQASPPPVPSPPSERPARSSKSGLSATPPPPAAAGAAFAIPTGFDGGLTPESGSYAAIIAGEDRPATIFDLEPADEAPATFPETSLAEMTAAFWQHEATSLVTVGPAAEIAAPETVRWESLREILAEEQASERANERRVDLALAAARLAALCGDEKQARAQVEIALGYDLPDSTASAARPGWSAVHRARLILAERTGAAGDDDAGNESLARLALLPHPDQEAYRVLQAEWALARSTGGAEDTSAAARITAAPAGLAKTLAEAELAWREPSAAAAILAAAGHARPGALGAALLALAAGRSEVARDFQAAAEQRSDGAILDGRRHLVRMGLLRDIARLEPDAAFAALVELLPVYASSPLKVALARWAAKLASRAGRYDEAWAQVAEPSTLGPATPVLARDRADLRGRARATPITPDEAVDLLSAVTGPSPGAASLALAALDACAWATGDDAIAAALARVDTLAANDAQAAAALGASVEALARRAADGATKRGALKLWQRIDPGRWLPAAFDVAASAEAEDVEPVWREIARRYPASPVFFRLAAAAGGGGRFADAAEILAAGARGWGGTPLALPLAELSAELLGRVDLSSACDRLERLVPGEGDEGALRWTVARALRRLGDRGRWTAHARAEPAEGSSPAHRAALLLESCFWHTPGDAEADDDGDAARIIDEALELLPLHPVALGLALAARPSAATMAKRWRADGGSRTTDDPASGRAGIESVVWSVLAGETAKALGAAAASLAAIASARAEAASAEEASPTARAEVGLLAPLVGGADLRPVLPAARGELASAAASGSVAAWRGLVRRLAWSETDLRARAALFTRLAASVGAPAALLVEAGELMARAGDGPAAEDLFRRAATAPDAAAVAGDLRVGLDPLAPSRLMPAAAAGSGTSAPAVATGGGGGGGGVAGPVRADRLLALESAVREGRWSDVVACLMDAPPHADLAEPSTLSLAVEIDAGRSSGARAAEIVARALSTVMPGLAGSSAAQIVASAPLVFKAYARGAREPGAWEAAAAVAAALADGRSAALLFVEAAAAAEIVPDAAAADRDLRAAVAADAASAPAAAALRRWLVRAARLAEAADAAGAEAEALVDPSLRVQALVRAAALAAASAPAVGASGAVAVTAVSEGAAPRSATAAVRAAGFLRRALQIAPADTEVFGKLRDLLEGLGDNRALVELLAHRLAHTSNPFEMTALHLARAELMAGPLDDRSAAKAELGAILAKEPHHGRALGRLADLEEADGNDAAAADLLIQRAAGERSPERLRELFLRLGRIHTQRAPDPKRAVAAYARVLQLDANNREALDALSQLYVGLGETKSATAMTERLVRIETSPERRTAYHVRLGQLAERAGDLRATAQHFRRAVDESPRDVPALGELIRFLEKTHDVAGRRHVLDTAAAELRAALTANPMDPIVREGFVAVQRWRGRPVSAAAAQELGALLGAPGADDAARAEGGGPGAAGARHLAALANPEVDDRTFPSSVPSSVRHLFRLIGPLERPGQRADLARFGVDRAHRIAEGRAPRDIFDGIAADLGASAYELYVAPAPAPAGDGRPDPMGAVLAALPAKPPAIVLANAIVKMGPEAIRFAAARTLRLAASYLDMALVGTEGDLAAWLSGAIRQFVPGYRRNDVPAERAAAATARMARLIPKKSRQEILPFALESSGEIDVAALAAGIRDGANRVGLLAEGRLDVALRVVLAHAGAAVSAETVRAHAEARGLVEFGLSDEHDDLVRLLA